DEGGQTDLKQTGAEYLTIKPIAKARDAREILGLIRQSLQDDGPFDPLIPPGPPSPPFRGRGRGFPVSGEPEGVPRFGGEGGREDEGVEKNPPQSSSWG
ncbi:MAG: hypothetical protein N2556_10250, partial [Anaerolineae bacterium]|nr:hypothetical protein [Anaerolineae bacterium]